MKYKFGQFIAKHRKIILIIALLLIIPSIIGIQATKINYDILSYLPGNIETVQGQKILTDEFHVGSFSIIIVDDTMPTKDILKMEDKIKEVDGVDKVVSGADLIGTTVPTEMLPDEAKDVINKDGTTPILVTFKTGMAEGSTLDSIDKIRDITGEQCKVSGVSASADDVRVILNSEMATYVVVAAVLCFLVLLIALDSYAVPAFLLGGIGIAILYNMGSNTMLGQISYITKAIATVLQLGVTMDFSIFLYHSYQRAKAQYDNKEEAMAKAIEATLSSVLGSSLTTIAGFLALCTMELTLGVDIGLVMAKGVLIGLICVVTILPSTLLIFDKLIEKTKHKEVLPKFNGLRKLAVNHYRLILIVFVIVAIPALYGNSHLNVYYNLTSTLPDSLASVPANKELSDKYGMVSTQIILVDKNMANYKVNEMLDKIDNLDGVEWTLGKSKLAGTFLPDEIIPSDVKDIFESGNYQMIVVNSSYETATDDANNLVDEINSIVKQYDNKAILAGEAPLMKDLVQVADHDFNMVNISSIAVVLIIMFIVLKSGSLPIILTAVIEFAICVNTSISCYSGQTLPFIASIVIGTIQLGATVDYAILMTNKYMDKRKTGATKKESAEFALDNSINSIIVSAFCFCSATLGVSLISKVDIAASICTLLSRGAIISMVVVILILPAFLITFDKLICKTTKGMKNLAN